LIFGYTIGQYSHFADQTNEENYQGIITDVKLWLSRWDYSKMFSYIK